MKTLAIDQGNTMVKWAVFEDNLLLSKTHSEQFNRQLITSLIVEQNIKSIIYSSTGKNEIREIPVLDFSHETPLPFKLDYHTPETLGLDRIANAAGAFAMYPKENVLVIDLGTCVTYDLVEKSGVYLGGSISPGLHMRHRAMHTFTTRLPLVNQPLEEISPIGKSTESSILSGAFYGLLGEVEKFIDLYKEEMPGLNVILTGGDAHHFEKELKSNIFADFDLTLKGLNEILLYNIG